MVCSYLVLAGIEQDDSAVSALLYVVFDDVLERSVKEDAVNVLLKQVISDLVSARIQAYSRTSEVLYGQALDPAAFCQYLNPDLAAVAIQNACSIFAGGWHDD